jgi:3-oxoacyl-[acyl-carrier protein] reductase
MNKVALITGASRGIGRAIASSLASDGWAVAINYKRSKDAAEALARELGGIAVQADVGSSAEVSAMFGDVEAKLSAVSLLVNNAGTSYYGLLSDMTDEDWSEMLQTNLTGAFNCCRAAIPAMVRAKRGCIINVASMWGEVGASCEAAYSATKAGLIGLTKALAKELGPSGIRVNAVSPGCIETDMMARFTPEDKAEMIDETPLERLGAPEDIAAAVSWLSSDKASFITGQIIGVSGGFVI